MACRQASTPISARFRCSTPMWTTVEVARTGLIRSQGSVCVAPGADHGLKFVPGGLDLVDVGEAHDPYQTSVPSKRGKSPWISAPR